VIPSVPFFKEESMATPKTFEPTKPFLAKETVMETIKGKTFDKSNEIVDGKNYEDCTFKQSTLIFKGGAIPNMTRCNFTNCDWQFQDAAARTLLFMSNLYHGGAKHVIDGFVQRITQMAPAA